MRIINVSLFLTVLLGGILLMLCVINPIVQAPSQDYVEVGFDPDHNTDAILVENTYSNGNLFLQMEHLQAIINNKDILVRITRDGSLLFERMISP